MVFKMNARKAAATAAGLLIIAGVVVGALQVSSSPKPTPAKPAPVVVVPQPVTTPEPEKTEATLIQTTAWVRSYFEKNPVPCSYVTGSGNGPGVLLAKTDMERQFASEQPTYSLNSAALNAYLQTIMYSTCK